jgi:aminoglycoside phosphotransferase (APT) family kinase protein
MVVDPRHTPRDAGLEGVLARFGVGHDDLLGFGGEARVYGLDAHRVVRVLHAGARLETVEDRYHLIAELARARPAFAVPDMLDAGEVGGRIYVLERRLEGQSLLRELESVEGPRRARLIDAHLDTAAALGDLHLDDRGWFGDVLVDDPVRTTDWHAYLEARAIRNLSRSVADLAAVDAAGIADGLPTPAHAAFVHLDAFVGNMLTDGERITAVIDFGLTSLSGDHRLDPLAAAAYLLAPEITPTGRPEDEDVVESWLRANGLWQWLEPATRWIAAYWSFAIDDPKVLSWCLRMLLDRS